MRNVRSYLIEPQISKVQDHSYYRLNTTTGVTYGSKYKRRYGAKFPVNSVQPQLEVVAGEQELSQNSTGVSERAILA